MWLQSSGVGEVPVVKLRSLGFIRRRWFTFKLVDPYFAMHFPAFLLGLADAKYERPPTPTPSAPQPLLYAVARCTRSEGNFGSRRLGRDRGEDSDVALEAPRSQSVHGFSVRRFWPLRGAARGRHGWRSCVGYLGRLGCL